MHEVLLFCDGSSLKNGTEHALTAAAALLECNGIRKLFATYIGPGTNQRAEIIAACIGLEQLKQPCKVTVISDSQYVVKTMTGEYRKKANLEIWNRLETATRSHKITWTWTKGHAGNPFQETCDKAARHTAELGKIDHQYFEKLLKTLSEEVDTNK